MIIKLQENIIHEVAGVLPDRWDKVTINLEIDFVDDEIVMSPKNKYFIKDKSHELRLGVDITNSFKELRAEMQKNETHHSAWTICDLEILSDGTFNYKFSYGEAPRLASLRES